MIVARGDADAEQATRAENFVDSIGVNVHLSYPSYANFSEVRSLILQLGIHHLRDGILGARYAPDFVSLAQRGVFGDYITAIGQTSSTWTGWVSMLGTPKYVDAFEGPNELDCSDPNYAKNLQAFMPVLWEAVQSNVPSVAVIGPSTGCGPDHFRSIGDLSRYMTFGNAHNYSNAYRPENAGPSSPGEARAAYQVVGGSKPVVTTEIGYGTAPNEGGSNVDVVSQTKYTPRLFLNQWTSGIGRTYWFELIDTPQEGAPYTTFGLVDRTYRPKPAYMALRNLIAVLSDRSAESFRPGSLAFQIGGNTADVAHTLLEKSDGEFDLCLWIAKNSYDVKSKTYSALPAQSITLTVASPLREASIAALGDDGGMKVSRLETKRDQRPVFRLSVTDSVMTVRMMPQASTKER